MIKADGKKWKIWFLTRAYLGKSKFKDDSDFSAVDTWPVLIFIDIFILPVFIGNIWLV